MPRLILVRHAKSDWSHEDLNDHDRPLNARGRAAAPLLGGELARRGLVPDQVFCSSAKRTQETWAGLSRELDGAATAEILTSLYHAPPETMLAVLKGATGNVVAMIAHNPGIGALAHKLLAAGPAHPKFGIYPTGATLIADLESWADLEYGRARLADFFVPRDLPGHP